MKILFFCHQLETGGTLNCTDVANLLSGTNINLTGSDILHHA